MTYQEFYDQSLAAPESFWAEQAKAIEWFTFPETILFKDERKFVPLVPGRHAKYFLFGAGLSRR